MSKYFHSEGKGCKFEPTKIAVNEKKHYSRVTIQRCKTHHKENICHCGWEFGHHYENKRF